LIRACQEAAGDEKVAVRRAALKALGVGLDASGALDEATVGIFVARVRDAALSVRKNALDGVQAALAKCVCVVRQR
jgi:hypothetical protein